MSGVLGLAELVSIDWLFYLSTLFDLELILLFPGLKFDEFDGLAAKAIDWLGLFADPYNDFACSLISEYLCLAGIYLSAFWVLSWLAFRDELFPDFTEGIGFLVMSLAVDCLFSYLFDVLAIELDSVMVFGILADTTLGKTLNPFIWLSTVKS